MNEAEEHIIGIDLGTTNSVVAVIEDRKPVVINNTEGANRTPSVVAFSAEGEVIVGEMAVRQSSTNPARTITAIKRLMGRFYSDLEEEAAQIPYPLIDGGNGVLVDIDGNGYTPQQISSLILKKLKTTAEDYLGCDVTKAVIAVPANFDDLQRQATVEAGEMAGLKVLRLINEPTAAAMAYGLGKDTQETVAIYDFGGGTFDISILEVDRNSFEVLATSGDPLLGGDDLDRALMDKVSADFLKQHGVDLRADRMSCYRLKEAVERAKCELSTMPQTRLTLPFVTQAAGRPLHLDMTVTRREFEELIEPIVARSIQLCKKTLAAKGLRCADIHKVLMVGGSSRIPLVQEMAADFFDREVFKGVNPDEVVAMGAATQAGVLGGKLEEVVLVDVTPHSLGIEVRDGRCSTIIEKNATVPVKAAKLFTTTEDDQDFVTVHVLQGESDRAESNRSLGKFMLTGLTPRPRGAARIQVTFFINTDGIVEISAKDLESGSEKGLTIVHSFLDDKELVSRRRRSRRRQRPKAATLGKVQPAFPGVGRPAAPAPEPEAADGFEPAGFAAPTFVELPADAATAAAHEAAAAAVPAEPVKVPAPGPRQTGPRGGEPTPVGDVSSTQQATYMRGAKPAPAVPAPPAVAPAPAFASHVGSVQPQLKETRVVDPGAAAERLKEVGAAPLGAPTPVPPARPPLPPMVKPPDATGVTERMDMAETLLAVGKADELALNLYQAAIPEYEAFLGSHPRAGWAILSLFRLRTLCAAAAAAAGDEAARLSHTAEALGLLQRAVDDQQLEAERAIAACGELLARTPNCGDAYALRGLLHERLGRLEEAIADLEAAENQEASYPEMLDALERLYSKRLAAQVAAGERADPAIQFKLVKVYLRKDKVDEAIGVLEPLANVRDYRPRAIKVLGLCFWQKKMHYLAWQKFKELELGEEIKDVLYRLAADMEGGAQLGHAREVLEHLVRAQADYRDAKVRLDGIAQRVKSRQSEADRAQRHEPRQILNDSRFIVLEEVNRGSMGVVYRAQDLVLDETVALKVLNEYLGSDPTAIERFKTEARAAKKLAHPNIVRIHDFFQSGGKQFLSMEYIEGENLKAILAQEGPMSAERLIDLCVVVARAIGYANSRGVIHRDIKPANIMIGANGEVRVTDFGIAKVLRTGDPTNTSSVIMGTPLYMSPEQIEGSAVDARSDIYSLGVVMYELISGRPPFSEGNIEYHHVMTPPPPLPPTVPPALAAIIMRAIEKDPKNRFQNMGELAQALADVRRQVVR